MLQQDDGSESMESGCGLFAGLAFRLQHVAAPVVGISRTSTGAVPQSAHSLVTRHTPRVCDGVITHTYVDFLCIYSFHGNIHYIWEHVRKSVTLDSSSDSLSSHFFYAMSWSPCYFSIF